MGKRGDAYGAGEERIGKDRWEVKKLLIIKLLRMIVGGHYYHLHSSLQW